MKAERNPQKTAVVFPGQGSGILGAGQMLMDAWPEALDRLEYYSMIADRDIAGLLGRPPGEDEIAVDLADIHLALVSYGMLAFEWIKQEVRCVPDMIAGHSLGEITALACARVISPEDALILARTRGRILALACSKTSGAMTALVGKAVSDIRQDIQQWRDGLADPPQIYEANVNGAEQLVVAGNPADLDRLAQALASTGIQAKRLAVAGAFHSPFMKEAAEKLFRMTHRLRFQTPEVPVLSSVTGQLLTETGSLPVQLSLQLVKPVEWNRVMERMEKAGIASLIEVTGTRPVLIPLAAKQKNWQVNCTDIKTLLKQSMKGKNNEQQVY